MKRKLLTVAVIAIFMSLIVYGTTAYFTADDTAHNVITSGGIDIQLLEWADQDKTVPFPKEGVSGVMPGTKVTKIVEVKNTGANTAYVRVKVAKAITLADGVKGEPDLGMMNLDFDETYWMLGDDGFYYYKEALKPGAVSKPLFACVSFDTAMGNIYQNSKATVDVKAYAVQTANNGNSVFEAAGWPEE